MSAVSKRGIKRKRGSDEPTNDSSKAYKKPAPPLDEKFRRKLYHGVKEVKKAAKIAKTRELQRLVKRLKELRSKGDQEDAVSVVEEQLEILKTLDHELIAIDILLRRLQKDRHIQSNEQAKAAVSDGLESSVPNTESNRANLGVLESRISSSKVLAGPVGDLVAALRALVLPPKVEDPKPILEAYDVFEGSDNDEDDGWESGSVQAQDRMDEDIDGVYDDITYSGNLSSTSLLAVKQKAKQQETTDSEGDNAPDHRTPRTSAKVRSSEKKGTLGADINTGHSEFLPSLAVGWTRGDLSASDWSGGNGSDDEKIDLNPRKNRRGQRARKAIWEKKYGKNANHVKKEREEEAEARKKRAEKMKNSVGRRFGKAQVDLENRSKDSGWKKKTEDRHGTGGKKDVPTHPSWEAAKRRKATPMIVPSTGKKIVF